MKKLIIMRGLPGSGKSTLAKSLGGVVCSADDFLGKNIEENLNYLLFALSAMESNEPLIIIDHTNIKYWEYKPFIAFGLQFGYTVEYLSPTTPWAWDPVKCFRKCKHGVPLEVIQNMKNNFETI